MFKLIFIAVLVASVQSAFQCNFEMRHDDMTGGFVVGTLKYDYEGGNVLYDFTQQDYRELYDYNANKGTQDFEQQWLYRSGATCFCETSAAQHAMPVFNKAQLNGQGDVYVPKNSDISLLVSVTFNGDTLAGATYKDGRKFVFTGCSTQTFPASTWNPPSGCKCGKPLDIVFVLDRSGSISVEEFIKEREFVQDFADQFEFGPLNTNLGLTNFNRETWDTLHLNIGTTKKQVDNGIDTLVCSSKDLRLDQSCKCCGTAVSSGMWNGADMLSEGPRTKTGKVLLVLTDGFHNRVRAGFDSKGKPIGSSSRCSGKACSDDLRNAVAYAKSVVGEELVIFAIAVSEDRNSLMEQLEVIADGHLERVITSDTFDNLDEIVAQLVAKTCDENTQPCGGCCGFCSCGVCKAPDTCDPVNFCDSVSVVGECCSVIPKPPTVCDDPTDLCRTHECVRTANDGQGACVSTPKPVPPSDVCFDYKCNPETGLPVIAADNCPVPPPDLTCADLSCNDFNDCTADSCDEETLKCEFVDNSTNCDTLKTMCNDVFCKVDGGCQVVEKDEAECNDNNLCTEDFCDPEKGCQNVNITCDVEADACHDVQCDPQLGCQKIPIVCPITGNCTIASCNITDDIGCSVTIEECGVPVALAAGITAGVIAGIVVAAVAGGLLAAGGGAYAYAHGAGGSPGAGVSNNPIYQPAGNSGANPLYRV